MGKLTLNQTWVLCLRMWRWIAEVWKKGDNVERLKSKWLRENGFGAAGIHEHCFFCHYAPNDCPKCPGRKVDEDFDCQDHDDYDYRMPKSFLTELLRLNRIRKAKK